MASFLCLGVVSTFTIFPHSSNPKRRIIYASQNVVKTPFAEFPRSHHHQDEMWVHDLTSNLKAASIEWKQKTFPRKRISSTCSL
jgi:hypothetical protein